MLDVKFTKHYLPKIAKSTTLNFVKQPKFKKMGILKNIKAALRKKKKLFFKLKKKKLNVVYKIFNLRKYSIIYKLRRKIIKLKFKRLDLDAVKFLNFFKFNNSWVSIKSKQNVKQIPTPVSPELNFEIETAIPHSLNTVASVEEVKPSKFFLSLTVHSNNIFINLSSPIKKKLRTVKFWSAGMFDFICSKKKIKFALFTMLKTVRFQLKRTPLYTLKIKAPKHLNKYIYRQLSFLRYKPKFYIYSSFKIFNGCRSKKKRRKKRLRFRFFR